MSNNKRIFVAFAIEDERIRNMLSGQSKNPDTPFEFVDMSAKEPWDYAWKTKCRTRIKGCDGVIVLVSRNTAGAAGALWEVRCAKEEGIPVIGVYCYSDDRPARLPEELSGTRVIAWSWEGIQKFIDAL